MSLADSWGSVTAPSGLVLVARMVALAMCRKPRATAHLAFGKRGFFGVYFRYFLQGGVELCGALGTPVAMKNLKCNGGELDLTGCSVLASLRTRRSTDGCACAAPSFA